MSDPILNTVPLSQGDSTTFNLAKASHRDRAKILGTLRSARRVALVDNLKIFAIDKLAAFAEVDAFDAAGPYSSVQFVDYMNTPEGTAAIFDYLARKSGVTDPHQIEKLMDNHEGDVVIVLAEAFGMTLAPKEEAGESNANPPTTAANPMNPTGNPPSYGSPPT